MKHPKNLSEFIDGRCTDSQKQNIEQHLERCGQCMDFVNRYAEFRSNMQVLADYTVPPYFASQVIRKARECAGDSFWTAFEFVPQRMVKALVVVSAVIIIIISFGPQPNATEQHALVPVADVEINQNLETPDEILEFALNAPKE